jgi:diadenosine tetraphosphate (Ap4A) HIT family hydrolase
MQAKKDSCTFCHPDDDLESRVINRTEDFTTYVSKPRFRYNHVIIAPSVHVEKMSELASKERQHILGNMTAEIALMADIIDGGRGTIIVQKFQPLQAENGIKVNHLHVHAWPRTLQDEENSILIPAPQSFEDFSLVNDDHVARSIMINGLRLRAARLGTPRRAQS